MWWWWSSSWIVVMTTLMMCLRFWTMNLLVVVVYDGESNLLQAGIRGRGLLQHLALFFIVSTLKSGGGGVCLFV
jgi:hypothetical protein